MSKKCVVIELQFRHESRIVLLADTIIGVEECGESAFSFVIHLENGKSLLIQSRNRADVVSTLISDLGWTRE